MFLTTDDLKERFEANLAASKQINVATAWATKGPALDLLCEAARTQGVKVKAIVGTFGNATHPDALERLREIGKLRLADGKQAMFHPKVYIFRGGVQPCAWIGSANFTQAGFALNDEVVFETRRVDDALTWFKRCWKECGALEPNAIDDYRRQRRNQGVSAHLADLVGGVGASTTKRVACLRGADSWKAYVAALKECDEYWPDWSVLGKRHSYVHTITEAHAVARSESWIGLPTKDRAMLLGLDDSEGTWSLLGSMAMAWTAKKVFKRYWEPKNELVLRRLRQSVDRVIRAADHEVADKAVSVLADLCPPESEGGLARFGPAVLTRLLALARPDRLISFNEGSRSGLYQLFGPPPKSLSIPEDYGRLLEELYKLPWYTDVTNRSAREGQLWSMRAALIDSFVYKPTN